VRTQHTASLRSLPSLCCCAAPYACTPRGARCGVLEPNQLLFCVYLKTYAQRAGRWHLWFLVAARRAVLRCQIMLARTTVNLLPSNRLDRILLSGASEGTMGMTRATQAVLA